MDELAKRPFKAAILRREPHEVTWEVMVTNTEEVAALVFLVVLVPTKMETMRWVKSGLR